MSGIEIAGVVLAVLPLIINQVDNYARGLETLRLFRKQRYLREFNGYATQLNTQQTLLRNTIERLLEDVVEYEHDLPRLMTNSDETLWQSKALEKEVKSKLEHDYDIFIANMANLLELLQTLRARLGLQVHDSEKPFSPDTTTNSSMDIRVFRTIFSNSVYRDLLSRMGTVNSHLQMLMEHAHHRRKSRKKRTVERTLARYRAARKSARSLYNALILGGCWKCVCRDQHTVYLRLDIDGGQNQGQEHDQKGGTSLISNEAPRFHVVLGSELSQWRFLEVECVHIPFSQSATGLRLASSSDTGSRKSSKKVAFNIESPSPNPKHINSAPTERMLAQIDDICSSLSSLSVQEVSCHALGVLTDQTQMTLQHKVYLTSVVPREEEFKSLKDLLATATTYTAQTYGQNRFSRRERLQLASDLARNVLVFHGCWLKPDWLIDDILVRSCSPPQPRSPFLSLPLSLLRSGNNLVPGSSLPKNELIQNEILFPLGLALTELSLCRTLADLQIPADRDQIATTTYFKTVSRCLQSVYDESGLRYGDAVRKCLFWSETSDIDMDNNEFQSSVFNAVVKPLLEDLQTFKPL
ncbi:hypothetical protein BJX63DRAFT_433248 [Aspergillus granulosus]|uniref:DUF7580 domain-containing protein n=1 Tax=Aspergillus granulosus TaxID=176169 RepID=A0ABR4H808_9EURO